MHRPLYIHSPTLFVCCINVSMYDGDNNIDQPPSARLATTLRPMNAVPPQRISIDIFPLISESLKDLEDTVLVYLKHTASWGLRKKTVPVFYRVVWEQCVHGLVGAAKLFTSICKKTMRKNVAPKQERSIKHKKESKRNKEREEGTHI